MNRGGNKVALAHFNFISPLPRNTESVLRKYDKIIVAEQNNGQFAGYLSEKFNNLPMIKYNKVNGQPFVVSDLIDFFTQELKK